MGIRLYINSKWVTHLFDAFSFSIHISETKLCDGTRFLIYINKNEEEMKIKIK